MVQPVSHCLSWQRRPLPSERHPALSSKGLKAKSVLCFSLEIQFGSISQVLKFQQCQQLHETKQGKESATVMSVITFYHSNQKLSSVQTCFSQLFHPKKCSPLSDCPLGFFACGSISSGPQRPCGRTESAVH